MSFQSSPTLYAKSEVPWFWARWWASFRAFLASLRAPFNTFIGKFFAAFIGWNSAASAYFRATKYGSDFVWFFVISRYVSARAIGGSSTEKYFRKIEPNKLKFSDTAPFTWYNDQIFLDRTLKYTKKIESPIKQLQFIVAETLLRDSESLATFVRNPRLDIEISEIVTINAKRVEMIKDLCAKLGIEEKDMKAACADIVSCQNLIYEFGVYCAVTKNTVPNISSWQLPHDPNSKSLIDAVTTFDKIIAVIGENISYGYLLLQKDGMTYPAQWHRMIQHNMTSTLRSAITNQDYYHSLETEIAFPSADISTDLSSIELELRIAKSWILNCLSDLLLTDDILDQLFQYRAQSGTVTVSIAEGSVLEKAINALLAHLTNTLKNKLPPEKHHTIPVKEAAIRIQLQETLTQEYFAERLEQAKAAFWIPENDAQGRCRKIEKARDQRRKDAADREKALAQNDPSGIYIEAIGPWEKLGKKLGKIFGTGSAIIFMAQVMFQGNFALLGILTSALGLIGLAAPPSWLIISLVSLSGIIAFYNSETFGTKKITKSICCLMRHIDQNFMFFNLEVNWKTKPWQSLLRMFKLIYCLTLGLGFVFVTNSLLYYSLIGFCFPVWIAASLTAFACIGSLALIIQIISNTFEPNPRSLQVEGKKRTRIGVIIGTTFGLFFAALTAYMNAVGGFLGLQSILSDQTIINILTWGFCLPGSVCFYFGPTINDCIKACNSFSVWLITQTPLRNLFSDDRIFELTSISMKDLQVNKPSSSSGYSYASAALAPATIPDREDTLVGDSSEDWLDHVYDTEGRMRTTSPFPCKASSSDDARFSGPRDPESHHPYPMSHTRHGNPGEDISQLLHATWLRRTSQDDVSFSTYPKGFKFSQDPQEVFLLAPDETDTGYLYYDLTKANGLPLATAHSSLPHA